MSSEKQTQGARDRAAIARELRKADRERVKALRESVKVARTQKREGVRVIRAGCREALGELRTRRRELLAEAAAVLEAIRKKRRACGGAIDAATARGLAELENARDALAEQLSLIAVEKAWTGRAKGLAPRGASRVARAERASESDDAVRANIPADLVPVFEQVKRAIRGNARMTRTEAFLHWVHDHPADVYELQEADHERQIARMVREQEELERELRRGSRYKRSAARMAADLDAREIMF